jgi:hypothetical protein
VCTKSECLAVWHLKNSLACRILGDEIEWVMMSGTKHTKIKLIFYFLYHRWCTVTVFLNNKKRVVCGMWYTARLSALSRWYVVRGTGTPWGVYSGSTLQVEGGIFVA